MKLDILYRPYIVLTFLLAPVAALAQNLPVISPVFPAPLQVKPVPPNYSTGTSPNFIRVWEPSRPLTTIVQAQSYTEAKDVKQTTQYIDGLGRLIQTVNRGNSPVTAEDAGKKDVVIPVLYDEMNREAFKYLPYVAAATDGGFRTNVFTEQAAFGDAQYGEEQVFYNQTVFEASPLNRVLKTMGAGNSWAGNNKGVSQTYGFNTAGDEVKIWDLISGEPVARVDNYVAGELNKTTVEDESGHLVIEYKDKTGQVILKKTARNNTPADGHTDWLCTYYIYDDVGNLRFVLPPRAVEALEGNGWNVASGSIRNELCFIYTYDSRRRQITRQKPGAEVEEMVYDSRDRLVFSRDGNLRYAGKWLATFYDELNRPVMIALYTSSQTQAQLQGELAGPTSVQNISSNISAPLSLTVNNHDSRAEYKAIQEIIFTDGFDTGLDETETLLGPGTTLYTETVAASNALPALQNAVEQALLEPLKYLYYDDYTFEGKKDPASLTMDAPLGTPFTDEQPINMQANGELTGTRVKVLGGSEQWLVSTSYYDTKGRIRQSITDNATGGTDETTFLYNFNGQVLNTNLVQRNPQSTLTVETELLTMTEYDHGGRVIRISKKLKDKDPVDIATNEYDVVGQLKEKTYKRSDNTVLESLNYDYNIRGWLTGINKSYVNDEDDHYFGQTLSYDYGFLQPQLNGNIAGAKWRGKTDGEIRAYGFAYDNSNRLMRADFNQLTAGAWNKSAGVNFDVLMGDGIHAAQAYDANGNIKRMQQWGLVAPGSSAPVDDLQYGYQELNELSNKLQRVTDSYNNPSSTLGDFKEITTNQTADYTYDRNGNLISDANKGIPSITYNHMNLPELITITGKGTIFYEYDADGVKHRKTVTDQTVSTTKVTVTDYVSGAIYEDHKLQSIAHEEGRIRISYPTGQPVKYTFDYFVKDHLGNVRMVLTEGTQQQLYMASMETESAAQENALFSNVDGSRSNRPTGYPQDQRIAPKNDYVARLNGNDPNRRVGPSVVLKVMAGDTIAISTKAFYKLAGPAQKKQALAPVGDMATALSLAFGGQGAGGLSHGGSGINRLPLNQQFYSNDYQRLKDKDPGKDLATQRPKAYLNYVLFDDQLKLVDDNSGVRQVQAQPDQVQVLAQDKMVVQKSGFLYVYTSNETPQDVFFDELMVVTQPGAVLEETHYYPFGLTMSGISSRTVYDPENKRGFNGNELQNMEFGDGSGLELYDFNARTYDAQIGRFISMDPATELAGSWSGYRFAFDNPISLNDPTGLWEGTYKQGDLGFDQIFNSLKNGTFRMNDGNDKDDEDDDNKKKRKTKQANVFAAPAITWEAMGALYGSGGIAASGGLSNFLKPEYWKAVSNDFDAKFQFGYYPKKIIPDDYTLPIVAGSTLIWIYNKLYSGSREGTTTYNLQSDYVLLFRGVYFGHPDYMNALNGIATPKGGHSDPRRHNWGDNESVFTSWSIFPLTANRFASQNGTKSGGIVLMKLFRISEATPSPDFMREGEVLIKGVVRGAVPLPAVRGLK